MRCRNCDYSLEGLRGPEHRCPECGATFDPSNPDTFHLLQCRNCRYSLEGLALRGLTDNRCPGCGSSFDPSDPESVIDSTREREMTTVLMFIWAFLFLVFGVPMLGAMLQVVLGL